MQLIATELEAVILLRLALN